MAKTFSLNTCGSTNYTARHHCTYLAKGHQRCQQATPFHRRRQVRHPACHRECACNIQASAEQGNKVAHTGLLPYCAGMPCCRLCMRVTAAAAHLVACAQPAAPACASPRWPLCRPRPAELWPRMHKTPLHSTLARSAAQCFNDLTYSNSCGCSASDRPVSSRIGYARA